MRLVDFSLLLYEEDPITIRDLAEAADRAGLGQRLRVVRSTDDALQVLAESRSGQGNARRPLPIFLINLECRGAYDLLEVLSKDSGRKPAVTVGLTSADAPSRIQRAYELAINSCLLQPTTQHEQLSMFLATRQYWEVMNLPPDAWR
jgi:CheY-like chemotaxis protein